MNKNELIVTTLIALANGMHKSWVSNDAIALLAPEYPTYKWHHVKKAAKKALKGAGKLNLATDDKYVQVLIIIFQSNLEIE